jgi:hypothetical protein
LRAAAERQPEPVVEQVEVPVITDDQLERLERVADALTAPAEAGREAAAALLEAVRQARAVRDTPAPSPVRAAQPRQAPPRAPRVAAPAPVTTDDGEVKLKEGARRMLGVLASQHPMRLTRVQLGTLSKVKHSGGTFSTYFGQLKRGGLIEEDGRDVGITQAGFDYLGAAVPDPKTPEEILEMYRSTLKAGAREMLDVLVEVHPAELTREELGERVGITPSGGTFGTYLGHLRRNGLIEVDGPMVRASDTLFMAVA